MKRRRAFVDDMQAAKDFATGDIVRRLGYREMLPSPFAGRVIYSNPKTGKVHVQWPWGDEEEPATELIRELNRDVAPNMALDQWLPTLEGTRFINDEGTVKQDTKWRKSLASRVAERYLRASFPIRLLRQYEDLTKPVWRAACRAWYHGTDEVSAYTSVLASFGEEFGEECCRLTVSNLYEHARRLSIYWKDSNRRYKVTKREKSTNNLTCPRCKGKLRPRKYRQDKQIMQCKDCGFTISPKDLIWDEVQTGEDVLLDGGLQLPVEDREGQLPGGAPEGMPEGEQ
jgi:predicted RNA-binding Zn-ribbon protein involved in translation (DUF1610 family)